MVQHLDFAQEFAHQIIGKKFPTATWIEKSRFLHGEIYTQQIAPQIEDLALAILRAWELHCVQSIKPPVFQALDENLPPADPNASSGSERQARNPKMPRGEGYQMSPGHSPCPPTQTSEAATIPPEPESTTPKPKVETEITVPPPALKPTMVNPAPVPKLWTMPLVFQFPNASVGQAYNVAVEPLKPVPGLKVQLIKVAEDFGLRFDIETSRLKGVPNKDGTFDIVVNFAVPGYQGEMTSQSRIIINPDPKSLWKNIPSDAHGLYAKPDEDGRFIEGTAGFTLVAGSKRGRSHAQKGTYRDDDFFIDSRVDGWQIAIVSDGAGSAKYSRRGSQIICQHGGKFLNATLDQGASANLDLLVEKWHEASSSGSGDADELHKLRNGLYTTLGYTAFDAMKAILKEVESKQDAGAVAKDYSSTALLSLVKRFPFGVFCGAFAVGDGAIGVYMANGTPLLLSEPDGGEFSGQTRFLSNDTVSGEELSKRLRHALIPESAFKGLLLMTDGISDPFFQTDKGMEMSERWGDLIEQIEAGTDLSKRKPDTADRLVDWLDFWSKGEHDDRTLAVIY